MTITNTSWNLVNTYAGLPDFFYSKIDLSKVSSPHLVVLNNDLAEHLGLDTDCLLYTSGNCEYIQEKGTYIPPSFV